MIKRAWLALICLSLVLAVAAPAAAQGPGDLQLVSTYRSIVVDGRDSVSLTLNLINPDEEQGHAADVVVASAPDGWETTLKSGGFIVRRVYVKPDDQIILNFQATPPEDVAGGEYDFVIEARDGGRLITRLEIRVTVEPTAPGSLTMSVEFPRLGGSAGENFQYKVDVRNDTNEELSVALSAEAPEGWRVNFQPEFENVNVSTLTLEAGRTQGLDVEVSVPEGTEPDEYPVTVRAAAGTAQATADLTVVIVGSFELELTTPTGRLNATATAGQERSVPIVLVNRGTAEIPSLSLSARAPSGWEAEFEPSSISVLPPQQAQEVTLKLRPSAKAIAGDYVVSVNARSPLASASQQLRVTVETPTTLGFIGLAVVLVVFAVLFALFSKYGRR